MKLIKSHFAVLFSLFVLLCGFQFIVFINKIIIEYEGYLSNDYSIVIASGEPLDIEALRAEKPIIKSIEKLDAKNVLEKLKNDISLPNMELLQRAMPMFYTIKLNRFPSSSVSNSLKNDLLKKSSILKVEIFAKTYNKIYHVFKLLNLIVWVFVIFSVVMSLLLASKQIRLWTYEHQERMYVMDLFGASFWTKNSALYKSAVADSLLAVFLSICVFTVIERLNYIRDIFGELNISIPHFVIYKDGAILLAIALFVAIFSIMLAVLRVKRA